MNPIRLRGTADVVAALPYQLGYHLEDCLVVVALRGRSVGMLQRLDLPEPGRARDAAGQLVEPLLREDPDAVLLVAYEGDAGAATAVLDAAAARIAGAGIAVLPRVVVRDGRWYGPDCHDGCCPEEGAALPEPADTPAVADFVGLEVAPLPSRGSLASLVAADDAVCREVAAALAQPVASWPGPSKRGRAVGVSRPSAEEGNDPHRAAVERLSRLSLWARACDVSVSARPVDELSAEGVALPQPADTPAVADFVGLEVAPLPSRESLASLVAADDAVCREVAAALAQPGASWPGPSKLGRAVGAGGPAADECGDPHRAAVERLSRLSLWARACDVSVSARPVDELSADGVAELVRSLEDRALRDGLIARLCPQTLPFDKLDEDLADALLTTLPEPAWARAAGGGGRAAALAARRLLTRLQWLVRAVPDEHCAPVLTVLASVAWWMGEGSVARVALERALEHVPDYRLARLLEQLLDHGIRPGGEAVQPALSA
jgi:hypothetical protein